MIKFAAGIEYAGTAYSGWQRQKHASSIQQHVEEAIGFVANQGVQLVCAGRTDAGVHAIEQVIHFESSAERDNRSWILGANSRLPRDIRIKWLKPVEPDFHARFSATARSYRYIISNTAIPSALFRHHAGWDYRPLNAKLMHNAAQVLLGEHDFSAFRAVGCQAKSAIRSVYEIQVERQGELLYFDIKANAFLYHMVRNIVGSLISVGHGQQTANWFVDVFEGRDRNQASATAAATGLYFLRAHYPDRFELPYEGSKPLLY